MSATRTPSVPSLERALLILEALSAGRAGLTLSQIARKTGVAKSSAHCLLLTLERLNYLEREETTGRYAMGRKFFSLASRGLTSVTIGRQALPHLLALAQRTGLTVHMAVFDGHEAVLIERIEPSGTSRIPTWVGKRMGLHCTAVGKALAAHMPPEVVGRLIAAHGLLRHNDNTIRSLKRLKEELERVRQSGYALDDEEEEIGGRCLGVPVFRDGRAVAAISVAGNTEQIVPSRFPDLLEDLQAAALAISQAGSFGSFGEGSLPDGLRSP